jgi:regulator of RNase E activity RraA
MADAALVETLKGTATCTLATILLKKGLRNQWVRGAMPMRADFPRTVGRAFTMRFIPSREDVPGALPGPMKVNRDAVEMMPEGAIAVADARGATDVATFGDIVVTRMALRGVAGIVTDGAVRDRAGLLAAGLPIWTAGITAPPPVTGHLLAGLQEPICCGGVAVFPGDFVVADADGVIVVPAGLAEDVAARAVELETLDAWNLEQVKRGVALTALQPLPGRKT